MAIPRDEVIQRLQAMRIVLRPHCTSKDEEAFAAALALLQQEPSWLPIETAPKDGTRVLLCNAIGKIGVSWYDAEEGRDQWATTCAAAFAPKYWMPLPLPPVPQETP